MVNILIAGYYGLDNIGDEAILSGMITSLKAYLPDADISVITNDAEITRDLHDVNPISHSFKKGIPNFLKNGLKNAEFRNVKKAIDECDVFILGGGSLLQDLKPYYLPALYSLLYLAQIKKKITVVYGIGAGPIDTSLGKSLTHKILNRTDLVTVRDSMSKKVLQNCGVNNVIQTIDPAFGMNPLNKEKSEPRNFISTTLYNWLQDSDVYCNPNKPNSLMDIRRSTMANIYSDLITKYNKELLFIPTVKTDVLGYNQINNLINLPNKSFVKEYKNSFEYVFSLLNVSDIIIGMRLHSLILATVMEIPFVPISYCGKVKSFLDLFNLEDLYLDVEDIGKDDFAQQLEQNIEKVILNKEFYSTLLHEKRVAFKEIALENAKMVANLIQK